MKNIVFIVLFFLISCLEKEPEVKELIPEINLSMAYPISDTVVEVAAGLLTDDLKNEIEYGVVFAENPNPTYETQKITLGKTSRGIRFGTKITGLKTGKNIFVKAYLKNISNQIIYSNELEITPSKSKYWRRLGDLKFDEGQFTGIPIKLDGNNLTFIRLNQYNEWEQYKHYNGIWFDPNYTWEQEKFRFPQFSPRQDPLFFSLNLSKEYTRPTAFLGGGFALSQTGVDAKLFLKDFYWVYDTQNFLGPLPFGNGPIAHFSLNRHEYLLEENNTDKFWSYFSLEQFIPKKPFPKLGPGYKYLGVSTFKKGYFLAQKLDETEVQLFEYDDITDSFTRKPDFPGVGRLDATTFSFNNKIYYGLGRSSQPVKGLTDIWEYDPATEKWTFVTNYPGTGNIKVMAADLGDYALLFCGYQVRASAAGAEKYYNANDSWMFIKN